MPTLDRKKESGWDTSVVVLEKANAKQGFGIAISGGRDNPHFQTGDISIIVSDIIKGSPADGKLRVGDVLVSVNERSVDGQSHSDAVTALKAAGMQARMEVRRPAPQRTQHLDAPVNGSPAGSDVDRGRSRKKPKEMEQESGEKKKRSSRSRSRNGEDGEEPRRSRSKSREKSGEGEDKPRRSRSKHREDGEEGGEKKRSHSRHREEGEDGEKKRSRSKHREDGENGEKKRSRSRHREDEEGGEKKRSRSRHREEGEDGEKKRSRSRHREEGEDGEKKRSRSKHREDGEEGEKRRSRSKNREDAEKQDDGESSEKPPRDRKEGDDSEKRLRRSRSKSRSRDDLTRSKSKESLHRSKNKTKLNEPNTIDIVLNRGETGYGFSLEQKIFIKDFANNSPAANAENLDKGDVVLQINGVPLENMKLAECIEIIRQATTQLTLTLVKPPKPAPVVAPVPEKPVEERSVETVEAAAPEPKLEEPKHVDSPREKPKHDKHHKSRSKDRKHSSDLRDSSDRKSSEDKPDSTPPSTPDPVNETKDSWSEATPQNYANQPNQEVEDMSAKLDRIKTEKKFERRMSQLPNARVISFRKTGSVGIQVAGGNSVGIFVAAIRPDSPAAKQGLKPGDQLIMCNEIDFEEITREEAVLILLALPDDVSLVVESKPPVFEQIKKELGDNFFIRVNFDHVDRVNTNELTFRKGEIFNVRDTMYQGLIGYWQAQRVGKNAQMLERGVLPNKSRAEQLAIAQKTEDKMVMTPGRSKLQRKNSIGGTLKKQNFVSQDRLDESSFAEGVQIPAYERVVLKVADFMRPVVVLGPLADLCRIRLLEEMPDRFDVPTPNAYDNPGDGNSIKLSEIRNAISRKKHCLLDITPEGIEMLMYAQLCPIVVLLNSPSRGAVREMRVSLVKELLSTPNLSTNFTGDPMTSKQVKRVFSNAKKLSEYYPHIFTAKINTHIAGADALSREFYGKLKEIIFTQQAQSAWMPEEKLDEGLEDMVFHPPNYMSYMSGVDSDTEGESTTSSPVLARKHFDDSPLASPVDEAPPLLPEPEKKREKSSDRKSRESSGDRRKSRDKSRKHHKRKEEDHSPERVDERISRTVEDLTEAAPPSREELIDDYRKPPSRHKNDYRKPPSRDEDDYRKPPSQNEDDYRKPPSQDEDDYRKPPSQDEDDYRKPPPRRESPVNDYRDAPPRNESPRGDYRNDYRDDYRQPPPPRSGYPRDDYTRNGHRDDNEDLPVLRDPAYDLPKPIPDSPPSRRPPEVKAKPNVNAIKVFPNELKNEHSMEEKRKSLKKVPEPEDHYDSPPKRHQSRDDSPPRRPPPRNESPPRRPPVRDETSPRCPPVRDDSPPRRPPVRDASPPRRPPVRDESPPRRPPVKDESPPRRPPVRNESPPRRPAPKEDLPPYRPPPPQKNDDFRPPEKVMSLQERMSKFQKKVTSQVPKTDDAPPPPRPSAPRNYIIDTRNKDGPLKYAENAYKPTAQFAEVKRIQPRAKPVVEPYATMEFSAPVESKPPPTPGYEYIQALDDPKDLYDRPRNTAEPYYNVLPSRNSTDPHYRQPPHSKHGGYSVPPSYNKPPPPSDYYPPYSSRDDQGEEEPTVIATARGWFDHRGGLLESSETNVSIYIPAGALPAGRQQEVYFKVCQDSKHMPPLDSNSGETLLSPLVMCGPHGLKFKKPIELRLPHKGASSDGMAFSLKSTDSPVGGAPGDWKNVKLGGRDLDSGRAYQVTDDTVSVLVDHF